MGVIWAEEGCFHTQRFKSFTSCNDLTSLSGFSAGDVFFAQLKCSLRKERESLLCTELERSLGHGVKSQKKHVEPGEIANYCYEKEGKKRLCSYICCIYLKTQ